MKVSSTPSWGSGPGPEGDGQLGLGVLAGLPVDPRATIAAYFTRIGHTESAGRSATPSRQGGCGRRLAVVQSSAHLRIVAWLI